MKKVIWILIGLLVLATTTGAILTANSKEDALIQIRDAKATYDSNVDKLVKLATYNSEPQCSIGFDEVAICTVEVSIPGYVDIMGEPTPFIVKMIDVDLTEEQVKEIVEKKVTEYYKTQVSETKVSYEYDFDLNGTDVYPTK